MEKNCFKLSYLQLVRIDSIECKVLVVDRVAGLPEHSGLDFVLLVRKKLELDVRVTGAGGSVFGGQFLALKHRHDKNVFVLLVPT